MQEIWVRFLGPEDPQQEEMASHFSILAQEISWGEEPGGLQFSWSQRVGPNLVTKHTQKNTMCKNFNYFIVGGGILVAKANSVRITSSEILAK